MFFLGSGLIFSRYVSYEMITTSGCPWRVTTCGSPFAAVSATAENLFFASCNAQVICPPFCLSGQFYYLACLAEKSVSNHVDSFKWLFSLNSLGVIHRRAF